MDAGDAYLSPSQINTKYQANYRCRVCHEAMNLHWFNGTSCPVCDKAACTKALEQEYAVALLDNQNYD